MVETKILENGRVIAGHQLPLSIIAVRLVGAETVPFGVQSHQTLPRAQALMDKNQSAGKDADCSGREWPKERKERFFNGSKGRQGVMSVFVSAFIS